jgi:hypothetical protein
MLKYLAEPDRLIWAHRHAILLTETMRDGAVHLAPFSRGISDPRCRLVETKEIHASTVVNSQHEPSTSIQFSSCPWRDGHRNFGLKRIQERKEKINNRHIHFQAVRGWASTHTFLPGVGCSLPEVSQILELDKRACQTGHEGDPYYLLEG